MKLPEPTPEKRALLDAYDAAVHSNDSRPPGPPGHERRRRIHPVTLLSLLALAAVAVWLFAARPEWVFARGVPAQSPAVREASLRLAMALQFQRIERFRDSAGHLPATLDQTGQPPGSFTYTTTQFGGFMLEGADSALHLTLRSEDSLATFVGDSYGVLSRRGAP
jgi:hypothetical protein